MKTILVISLISDDKPGVVEALAKVIADHGGNWQESRMAHMAGKFAGIVQVSVATEQAESLKIALNAMSDIRILLDEASPHNSTQGEYRSVVFNAIGNDRPGIVREIAQAFASHGINLAELHTDYTSAPHSGEPLFQAQGELQLPQDIDGDKLNEQLDDIADELGIEIDIEVSDAH